MSNIKQKLQNKKIEKIEKREKFQLFDTINVRLYIHLFDYLD